MSLLIAWRIFQKPKGHFTVWQQSSQKCKTTSTRSVKHCSETYKASKHELKGHMRNNAYKPSMRLGTVSFSIASILIHTSKYSYIIIWVCTSHMYTPYVVVEVVCWRTCRGSKEKTSQDKKHHKKLQTSKWNTDSLCKFDDSRSFTFLCADRGIRSWHFSLVVRWVAWPKKYTWLHFQGWSALTLRFPFSASAAFFHNWLELFECDGTLAFASWKRSQKFQPC